MPRTDDPAAIVWFRRDLRIEDNPAWEAALRAHDRVIAAFVIDPVVMQQAGSRRQATLSAYLESLDRLLRVRGADLIVLSGSAPAAAVARLAAEAGADEVHVNRDPSPYAQRRDTAVRRALASLGEPARLIIHDGNSVLPPGSVLTAKGTLSRVFTPFYKRWSAALADEPALPELLGPTDPPPADGSPRPTGRSRGDDPPWNRLVDWLDRVDRYPETRDLPGIDGTSGLSVDLKFGALSPRTVVEVTGLHSEGRRAFVRQLAWRDWWFHLLFDRPTLATNAFKAEFDSIVWRDAPTDFDAWCHGRTGYPIVDAGMRQLAATGLMHNRVRMITASFLVKDLLIDWRLGERYFRRELLDADLAQNAGNWQWVAGTGPDAAPYFRIFNPTAQAKRFDPSGDYVRTWVPELEALRSSSIHEPWAMGPLELAGAGIVLGDTYPERIVDHAVARQRTIDAYGAAKRTQSAK